MDRVLRAQVINEVRAAMTAIMEEYDERYVTAEELVKQFQMFTPGWMERYAYMLPRVRAIATEDGQEHRTRFAYPRNKIARMIADGSIEELTGSKGIAG